jgi:futalosine hydrolase
MWILVVAATLPEIAAVVRELTPPAADRQHHSYQNHNIDIVVTGVGMVATAAWTARALAQRSYDVALNLGVCGSFSPRLAPGTAVHVVSDRIADLGAEDDGRFMTIDELGLPSEHAFVNDSPPDSAALRALPAVAGITVNTVHGRAGSIADVVARFHPDVESMEGAGFMHACKMADVTFAAIRAVSNVVEKRNRAAWKLDDAIAALTRTALAVIEDL